MSSPGSNNINIRLDIQIPAGVDAPCAKLDSDRFHVLYGTANPSGGRWSVLPATDSALGQICATVTYNNPVGNVKAFVYPDACYPPSPTVFHPFPNCAVSGVPSNGKTTWTWTYPGTMIKGADHIVSTTSGAPNRLGLWYLNSGLADVPINYRFDDSPSFLGYTDTRPCGSGSGSGMMPQHWMGELLESEVLLISISDGPYAGHHNAKRRAEQEWVVQVGNDPWVVGVGPTGDLTLRVGRRIIPTRTISSNPFMATFPGEAFGAKAKVLVTLP